MKIQISYTKEEEREASAAVAALWAALPELDLRRKENHPPRKHIYIRTQEPKEKT